jgi:hypothetical protein
VLGASGPPLGTCVLDCPATRPVAQALNSTRDQLLRQELRQQQKLLAMLEEAGSAPKRPQPYRLAWGGQTPSGNSGARRARPGSAPAAGAGHGAPYVSPGRQRRLALEARPRYIWVP